jgi:medium-chain acyl-[acyl-carrier-protein] hydrolase
MSCSTPFADWITFPQPRPGARLRLFCFPFAGGGAATYRNWPSYLPAAIEVCAIQPPGREYRIQETPYSRLPDLMEKLTGALASYLDLPFAFFGHSLGGLLAFECARSLRRAQGIEPVHLFVSAARAPHAPLAREPIHQLPDSRFADALRRLNGTPEAVLANAELMALVLPTLRADFSLYETYVYAAEPPLECPVSAFGGTRDCEVGKQAIEGWQQHTLGRFTLRMFPGDHFFLQSAHPALQYLIAEDLLSPCETIR